MEVFPWISTNVGEQIVGVLMMIWSYGVETFRVYTLSFSLLYESNGLYWLQNFSWLGEKVGWWWDECGILNLSKIKVHGEVLNDPVVISWQDSTNKILEDGC